MAKNQVEKENEKQEQNLANINAYAYKEHLENSFEKDIKVDLNELQKRNLLKKQDLAHTKSWLDSFSNINETHVTIDHSRELALLEYYSNMDCVEIDSGIKTIFQSNQKAISEIDLSDAKEEYLYAYKEYQDLLERMDDKKREDTGINSLDREEKKIKEDEKKTNKNIAEAEKKVRESRNKARASKYTVSPKSVFLGILTGNKKDFNTITSSWKSVTDAKKSLKEAKKAKKQIAERKEALKEKALRLQMSKDKLTIKIGNALEKMTTASEKISNQHQIAKTINSQSKILADKLHKYYKSIDKYATIQKIYNNPSTLENINDKELSDCVNKYNLQKRKFIINSDGSCITNITDTIHNVNKQKIDIENTLSLSNNTDKKEQVKKLQESIKLKDDETLNNLLIACQQSNNTDTISLMKYKYLRQKKEINTLEKDIKDITDNLPTEASNEDLSKLLEKQQKLKYHKYELNNSEYLKLSNSLNKYIELSNDYELLLKYKDEDIKFYNNRTLESSDIQIAESQKDQAISELAKKHQKLPFENQQGQDR